MLSADEGVGLAVLEMAFTREDTDGRDTGSGMGGTPLASHLALRRSDR